jgi:magnesium transporter
MCDKETVMPESKFFHISPSGKLTRCPNEKTAFAELKKSGYIWLDYHQPTREEMESLIKPLGLHPLSIEDCLDENQIPKIDDYPGYTFILFNAFKYLQETLSIIEVDAFLGKNFLLTISGQGSTEWQLIQSIEKILALNGEDVHAGPAFLLHIILDQIVDQKFTVIESLEEDLNKSEETILSDLGHYDPAGLMHLRRDLLNVRKSLFHEREILVKICRRDSPYIPERAIFFYRDIYDHLAKSFELTESYRDLVTSLMEMYLSMLNNQMTRAANETNITVRRLTFITTIFMPLSLLAGIGGMSEFSMMTGPQNWRIAYPLFLLAMVIIGVANYFLLKLIDRNRMKKHVG